MISISICRFSFLRYLTMAPINYNVCVFCQSKKAEKLKNPANAGDTSTISSTYKNISDLLSSYKKYNLLSKYEHLNEMTTWFLDFEQYNAKWHKSCRLKFSVGKLNKKIGDAKNDAPVVRKKVRSKAKETNKNVCLFCEEADGRQLRQCYTIELDHKIRTLSKNSEQYSHVTAKLSEGDMVATESKYHLACLTNFYKRTERLQNPEELCNDVAFDEVYKRISDWMRSEEEENLLFLKNLHSLFVSIMKEANEDDTSINRTRLKHKIMDKFPDLICSKKGKDIVFYKPAIADNLVKTALPLNAAKDRKMDEVVHIVREMLSDFTKDDTALQEDSVPKNLVEFITKVLFGRLQHSQAALTIAQLIQFNFVKQIRSDKQSYRRHGASQETPLTRYTGKKFWK